jgi:hypothetical protein
MRRLQKPRFLQPATKLMSEKSAAGDFFPIKKQNPTGGLTTSLSGWLSPLPAGT